MTSSTPAGWRQLAAPGDHAGVNPRTEVVVVTVEGHEFVLPMAAAMMSVILSGWIRPEGAEVQHEEVLVIPLTGADATAAAFPSVAKFLVHFTGTALKPTQLEKPLKANLRDLLSDWEKEFVFTDLIQGDVDAELFRALRLADFLSIGPLVQLCCAAIADMLRTKTPLELCKIFNITDQILLDILNDKEPAPES